MEQTPDQLIEAMVAPSRTHLATFGSELKGAGAEAWSSYEALTRAATALTGIGSTAADKIAKTLADDALPIDHRQRVAAELRDTATREIETQRAIANTAAMTLESSLLAGLKPQPSADAGTRGLLRDELRNILGGKTGTDLVTAAVDYLGKDAGHDAEMLGSFGRSLFEGQGQGALWSTFQSAAAGKLAMGTGGTERQQAARRALTQFRERAMIGRVSAFYQGARMTLAKDQPARSRA